MWRVSATGPQGSVEAQEGSRRASEGACLSPCLQSSPGLQGLPAPASCWMGICGSHDDFLPVQSKQQLATWPHAGIARELLQNPDAWAPPRFNWSEV